jgi:hypothetical protein
VYITCNTVIGIVHLIQILNVSDKTLIKALGPEKRAHPAFKKTIALYTASIGQ